jgi:hypothetical protein
MVPVTLREEGWGIMKSGPHMIDEKILPLLGIKLQPSSLQPVTLLTELQWHMI